MFESSPLKVKREGKTFIISFLHILCARSFDFRKWVSHTYTYTSARKACRCYVMCIISACTTNNFPLMFQIFKSSVYYLITWPNYRRNFNQSKNYEIKTVNFCVSFILTFAKLIYDHKKLWNSYKGQMHMSCRDIDKLHDRLHYLCYISFLKYRSAWYIRPGLIIFQPQK